MWKRIPKKVNVKFPGDGGRIGPGLGIDVRVIRSGNAAESPRVYADR